MPTQYTGPTRRLVSRIAIALILVATASGLARAESLLLKTGDRVAIVGDSITEQKQYSRFIEDYLLVCVPELDLKAFQFGWGGERAPGFASRMDNDMVPWHPTVVTTCFGMNDGGYREYNDNTGKHYEDGTRRIQSRMKEIGARMVVGGPGPVDADTWRRESPDADVMYNSTLSRLNQIAGKLAEEHGFVFANLHPLMMDVMTRAKAALGKGYHVCGGDGVHPSANGHLVMAYAFLKAMGLEGNIGTLSVDLKGATIASDGHRVLTVKDGAVEIESTRYPFCFYGNEKDPNGTRSILPFLPFNRDLNRLTLVVRNLGSAQADITWGNATKSFSREQLAGGINLAAEFPENPFVEPFRQVDQVVARKQSFETTMVKNMVTHFRRLKGDMKDDAEFAALLDKLYGKLSDRHDAYHKQAREAIKPVRHTITIRPKAE